MSEILWRSTELIATKLLTFFFKVKLILIEIFIEIRICRNPGFLQVTGVFNPHAVNNHTDNFSSKQEASVFTCCKARTPLHQLCGMPQTKNSLLRKDTHTGSKKYSGGYWG